MAKLDRLLKKARAAAKKGNPAKALGYFRDACAEAPTDVDVWLERVEAARAAKDQADAVDALFRVADMHARAGLVEQAAEHARAVLEMDPKHGGARRFARMAREEPEGGGEGGGEVLRQAQDARAEEAGEGESAVLRQAQDARAEEEGESAVLRQAQDARAEEEGEAEVVRPPEQPKMIDGAPVEQLGAIEPEVVARLERQPRERPRPQVRVSLAPEPGQSLAAWLMERAATGPRQAHAGEFLLGSVTGQIALGELQAAADAEPAEIPLDDERELKLVKAVAAAIGSSPLLSELDSDLMKHLVEGGSMQVCEAGKVVFMEGESGDSLFLVLEGAVDVEKNDERASRPQRLATLRRGAFFGEMALLGEAPRSATVRAAQSTTLLEVSRDAVRALIERDDRVRKLLMRFFRARLVGTFMATSPLFNELVPSERRDLVTRFRLRELPAGYDVVTQGQPGDGLHLVLAGELVAYLATEDRVLGVLRPGDAFGEMALLSGESASASVRAVARSWVLRLPVADFEAIASNHPLLRASLDELASKRRAENAARLQTRVRPV